METCLYQKSLVTNVQNEKQVKFNASKHKLIHKWKCKGGLSPVVN